MHQQLDCSAHSNIEVGQGAAEDLYRESALEEAMLELVALNGEGWLEAFRDKLVSKMRDHVVGGDEVFDGAPDNEMLQLPARRQQFIANGEQALAVSIAAVHHQLATRGRG